MQVGMLGQFEVRTDDGCLVDIPGARLRGLLIALALEPGRVVPKAMLIDWIWGEHPPIDATNALQRLVSRLRKVLPDGVVESHTDGYRLMVKPDDVDAVRFERLAVLGQSRTENDSRRARLLREALELWRGAAMQNVGLVDSATFDAAVARLEGRRLAAAEERADAEIALGRGVEMVGELTDLVAAHPLRGRLVAALMRALVAAGRSSEALLVYQRAREALADTLGVDPSPELSALHVSLLRGDVGRHEEKKNTNLRVELTSFVGKGADIDAVRSLVSQHRLTTLIGPGGSGKTRLAVETARKLLDDFSDGAWLVELAAVGPAGDVARSTLAGLGLRDALLGEVAHEDLTDRLIAAIRGREALLVLDNCEHLIDSVPAFVHRVLGECRTLRILATSREPLRLTGEALWLVEPLALPTLDAGPREIESSPAVALLRDRASTVRRDLVIDAPMLSKMARVCRALDGMPLAIELAAARLRTMPIDQLVHRLDDRFRLLTNGSRVAAPRHRTLRAVVDWSWDLLTDAEQMVLRRLSVFSGGATLEAAERVCAGEAVEPGHVLEVLTALTDKSLLSAQGGQASRFRMISMINEYAALRLAEAGETELVRRAHLAYFTELTETAEPHLRRAGQLDWLSRLAAEHDNIGSAMRGALAAGEASAAMRLAAGAGWYWWLGGHKTEGLELITAATRLPGEVPDDVQATVYALVVMFLSSGRGDQHRAAEWIHKAHLLSLNSRNHHPLLGFVAPLERMLREPDSFLPSFETLLDNEDPWARALARLHLGKMRIVLGANGWEADLALETALAEFRALGERFGISFALTELADRIATRGDFARACQHYEQAVAVVGQVGATEDIIRMRARQAQLYWLLGDEDASAAAIADARRCARWVTWPDALADLALAEAELARWRGRDEEAYRQLGIATSMLGADADQASVRAVTHDLLGYLADDLGESRAHRVAACAAAAATGHAPLVAQVLVGVADLAVRRDDFDQAAQLLAASARVRGLPDRSHPDEVRIEQMLLSRLDTRFVEAAQEGAQTSWAQLAEVTLAS